MDDPATVFGIFGQHRTRSNDGTRLRIRDGNLVAEIKARVSDLAARDNRARHAGWLIDYSPLRTDALTERSSFDAILTSAVHGTRRLPFALGREWVHTGGGGMESAVRDDARNLQKAIEAAFRRVVLRGSSDTVDPAEATAVSL